MRINVFIRNDGSYWADYDTSTESGTVLKQCSVDTEREIRKLISNPGPWVPERVRALAQRALVEKLQYPRPPLHPKRVLDRTFLGRLKFLFTGK
jgi:hypothetical protein